MKHQVKYRILTITSKLSLDLLISTDTNNPRFGSPEKTTELNGDTFTNIMHIPRFTLSIIRPSEINEEGKWTKPPYNANDHLRMSRNQISILLSELRRIDKALNIPDMYSYSDKRLIINESLADEHRAVFDINNTVVELLPVVIVQPIDENRVEGIQMKFNNDQSISFLTLNDLQSLIYTLRTMNVDSIVLNLHAIYFHNESSLDQNDVIKPIVDIKPKHVIE